MFLQFWGCVVPYHKNSKKAIDRRQNACYTYPMPRNLERRRALQNAWYHSNKNNPNHFLHSIQGRFSILRNCAKRREISCGLTFQEYCELVETGSCVYCEAPLPSRGGGLDRKISSAGYTRENSVPCCATCNRIRGKDDISHEEMFKVVKLLKTLRTK